MMIYKRLVLATAIGLGWTSMALAASVTAYDNEADYTAATSGNTVFLDFDGLTTGAGDGVFTGVDFNTLTAATPDNVIYNGAQITDAGSTTAPNGVGTLQGILSSGALAIGFDLLSVEAPGVVDFYDDTDSLIASVNYNSSGFVGFITDMPVSRFDVVAGIFATSGGSDRVFIDNFRISTPNSTPAVPLPASSLLLLAGIGGLAGLRTRQKRTAQV